MEPTEEQKLAWHSQITRDAKDTWRDSESIGEVAGQLSVVVKTRAWARFEISGKIYENSSFRDFIESHPPRGLGASMDDLEFRLDAAKDREDAQLVREALNYSDSQNAVEIMERHKEMTGETMTQAEAAKRAGISQQAVSQALTSKSCESKETLVNPFKSDRDRADFNKLPREAKERQRLSGGDHRKKAVVVNLPEPIQARDAAGKAKPTGR